MTLRSEPFTPKAVPKVSVNVREAAWALGLGIKAVRKLIADGKLQTIPHLGPNTIRIATSELERFANGVEA